MNPLPTLKIRPATAADHAAWWLLWRGYQAFYEIDLPQATTATTWARLLDPAEPMHAAVAALDGCIVGIAHFIEHRSTSSPQNSVYLQDLFTAPEARGQGVGRALIEHVYERARQLGAAEVHWLTHESNAQAQQLYHQLADKPGFVQYCKSLG